MEHISTNDSGHADALVSEIASDEEIRELAEDIVRFCPDLTALLLGMSSKGRSILSAN
tara:strand:+ start:758 stop:931 length:174 start_codon:yes stop_codon:yes gene_type:complete